MDRSNISSFNMKLIFDLSEGNPGATVFVTEVLMIYKDIGELVLQKMLDADIKGSKLYMLWNDCCDRDTAYTVRIMLTHEIDDIITHINYEGGRGIPYNRTEEESGYDNTEVE